MTQDFFQHSLSKLHLKNEQSQSYNKHIKESSRHLNSQANEKNTTKKKNAKRQNSSSTKSCLHVDPQ